jgi:hypothetical protein
MSTRQIRKRIERAERKGAPQQPYPDFEVWGQTACGDDILLFRTWRDAAGTDHVYPAPMEVPNE